MTQALRVLIVEDSEDDAYLVVRELRKGGYEPVFRRVDTAEGMAAALEEEPWDCVIADYALPRFDALGALEVLQETDLDLPFIIVSGTVGEGTAVGAMKAGADDYIMKHRLARLAPAVEGELREAGERHKRREAEQELAQAAGHWEATFNAIQDSLCILDRDRRIIRANAATCAAFSRRQVLGTVCCELLHGAPEPCAGCPAEEAFRTGRAVQGDVQAELLGGRWFSVTAYPLVGPDGSVAQVVHVARDITERRQAEEAVKASGERERAFAARLTALHEVGNELSKVESVDELCRLAVERSRGRLGFDRLSIWLVDPTDPTFVAGTWGVAEDGSVRDEHHSRLPTDHSPFVRSVVEDGTMLEVQQNVELFDESGRSVGIGTSALAALWDGEDVIGFVALDNLLRGEPITEHETDLLQLYASVLGHLCTRKRAEQELDSERRFSDAIIDTSGALIVVLDAEGRILRFNRACEEVTGYRADEVLGRPLWDVLVPPEERNKVRGVFQALTSDTPFSAYENHWLTKDGGRRLLSWANTRVLDQEGRPRWVISTGIDVTEQREMALRLQRAEKLEAVGQLAGGVAHDFNNLLTAIMGYIDLNLPDLPAETQLYEDLVQVKDAAKRAADLTRQLLTFSRRQVAQPEVIDFNSCVRDVSGMLRYLIEENVEVSLSIWPEPLTVKADLAQMGQVLMNLAVNARDAMPQGGVLTIGTERADMEGTDLGTGLDLEAGAYARLTVADTGVGMAPEVRERMYDPFFTTKGVGHGTGLGLSTVYGIVQQHGGAIKCESDVGKGATFRVYIPLVDEPESSPPDRTDVAFRFSGDETILLVEDEDEVRALAGRALQEFGYNVLAARNGEEALSLLEGHDGEVDLLLTDIVMPGMDGRELAQRMRLARPEVRLLFISGYADDAEEMAKRGLEAARLLPKPFTAHRLAKEVRDALDLDVHGGGAQ